MVRLSVTREDHPEKFYLSRVPGLEFIRFTVQDTGIGIRAEDRERIFDEFEQASSSYAQKYGGVGLGLALTRKLVELHGGMITVESTPGEGSTFTFLIPVTSPVPEAVVPEPVQSVSLTFPWMKEEAPLILVVQDDLATAELLTLHLPQSGYRSLHQIINLNPNTTNIIKTIRRNNSGIEPAIHFLTEKKSKQEGGQ